MSIVCAISTSCIAALFFDLSAQTRLTPIYVLVVSSLAIIQYGTGGLLLGTVIGNRINTWVGAIIYAIPMFAIQLLSFLGVSGASFAEQVQSDPCEIMQVVYGLLNPIVSFYSVRLGQSFSKNFSAPNTALNISWAHWLWIVPIGLYQTISVPLFLLLLMWKIDFLTGYVEPSIFSLPAMLPRIIVYFILMGVLTAIYNSYEELAGDKSSRGKKIWIVLGTWILLTALQSIILLYAMGEGKHRAKQQQKKIFEEYSKIIDEDPKNSKFYFRRGKEYFEEEDYKKAIDDYNKAIHLNREGANYYAARGDAFYELEDWTNAMTDYEKVAATSPSNIDAFLKRGNVFKKLNKKDKAMIDYNQALNLKAITAEDYLDRGLAFEALLKNQEAIESYTKAKDLDPWDPRIYIARGLCYHKIGQTKKALADAAKAMAVFPQTADDYATVGNSYKNQGDYERSIDNLSHALSINSENAKLYLERGNVYHILGEEQAAKRDYDKALLLDPKIKTKQ